ncbi:MAG: 50S ribosomal protein L28 [Anaerolineae bacterium]|nr:50S ribosomal protein L28 [Anaerolineae bacterium]
MAKCEICGKKPMSGHNVSHSKRRTKRKFRPNIQYVLVVENGQVVRKRACTKCIKTLNKNPKI